MHTYFSPIRLFDVLPTVWDDKFIRKIQSKWMVRKDLEGERVKVGQGTFLSGQDVVELLEEMRIPENRKVHLEIYNDTDILHFLENAQITQSLLNRVDLWVAISSEALARVKKLFYTALDHAFVESLKSESASKVTQLTVLASKSNASDVHLVKTAEYVQLQIQKLYRGYLSQDSSIVAMLRNTFSSVPSSGFIASIQALPNSLDMIKKVYFETLLASGYTSYQQGDFIRPFIIVFYMARVDLPDDITYQVFKAEKIFRTHFFRTLKKPLIRLAIVVLFITVLLVGACVIL